MGWGVAGRGKVCNAHRWGKAGREEMGKAATPWGITLLGICPGKGFGWQHGVGFGGRPSERAAWPQLTSFLGNGGRLVPAAWSRGES